MTDLTEQWKKGELDIDECYFAETEGGIYKTTGEYLNSSSCIHGFDITTILEPVPSYEEWKQLKEYERIVTSYNMKPIDYDIACETVNKLLDERKALKEQNAELEDTVEALESELKEVCDVLIRKCPEMKEWVMLNWKNLYEVDND